MSIQHHSREEIEEARAAQERLLSEFLGVSSKTFPRGQLNEQDEGETAYAIAADRDKGVVIIQFSKPTAWIGLDLPSAENLWRVLAEKIKELKA